MVKYDTYQYDTEQELIDDLESLGYTYTEPLSQGTLQHEDGEYLDYVYFNQIVTNYPVTEEGWEPIYSTEVYINSARKGNIKLPSNKKLKGNNRKYFNNYINRFLGEKIK